jgi:hypothetical protein
MRRVRKARRDRVDLISRPPRGALDALGGGGPPGLEPLDQLDELADLWRRGLLTRALFERQRDAVIDRSTRTRASGRPRSCAGPARRPRPAS